MTWSQLSQASSRLWRYRWAVVGFGVSAATILTMIRIADLDQLSGALRKFNWKDVVEAGFALLAFYLLQAFRWRIILPDLSSISFSRCLGLLLVSQMLNMILPLRAGDGLRPLLARRAARVSLSRSALSVVVERILDVFCLILLAVLTSLVSPVVANWIGAQLVTILALLGMITTLWMVLLHPQELEKCLDAIGQYSPGALRNVWAKARVLLDKISLAWRDMVTFPRMVGAALASGLSFAFAALTYERIFAAAGLTLPVEAIVVVLVASQLGSAIPSAPASLGVFHGIVMSTLTLWGVPLTTGMATAIVLHALMALLPIALGSIAGAFEIYIAFREQLKPTN